MPGPCGRAHSTTSRRSGACPVRVIRPGRRSKDLLVETALGDLEPLGVECLDRVGGPRHESFGILVRLEIGEDPVGERAAIAALGTSDAHTKPEEVLGAEALRDRPEAVV